MKNKFKNTLIALLIAVASPAWVFAGDPLVGTQFTYQGELLDNGSPANGIYDLQVNLHYNENNNTKVDVFNLPDVEVTNGLFSVVVDYGDLPFDGEARFLEFRVRPGDATGSYETLSPKQRINTTPYAIQAEFAVNGASPWMDNGSDISYSNQVFVGNRNTVSGSQLTVDSAANESPLRVFINGTTRLIVQENGGTSIGINQDAPFRGLNVRGDATQGFDAHGFVKAAAIIECGIGDVGTSGNSIRFFNNVNGNDFTQTRTGAGGSCEITVPFDVTDAFYNVSAMASGGANLFETMVGSCSTSAANQLSCQLHSISGANTALKAGVIQLLIY